MRSGISAGKESEPRHFPKQKLGGISRSDSTRQKRDFLKKLVAVYN